MTSLLRGFRQPTRFASTCLRLSQSAELTVANAKALAGDDRDADLFITVHGDVPMTVRA